MEKEFNCTDDIKKGEEKEFNSTDDLKEEENNLNVVKSNDNVVSTNASLEQNGKSVQNVNYPANVFNIDTINYTPPSIVVPSQDYTIEELIELEELDKEIEEISKFYFVMKDDFRFAVNKKTFLTWKGVGAGRYFKNYINKCPVLNKLVHIVLERQEMSKCYKRCQCIDENDKKYRFLKYLDDKIMI